MPTVGRKVLWTVYLIVFVDLFQLTFVYPFMPVLVQSLGGGETQIALANSFASAGEAIGCPILGRFADRFGRRPVLLVSTVGSAISAVILGFSGSYPMVLVARTINGLSGGTMGIANAYIADVTTADERPGYMSNLTGALGLGLSVGPVVGSFLYTEGGINLACFAAGAVSMVNFLCVLFFLPESRAISRGGGDSSAPAGAQGGGPEPGGPARLPLAVWALFFAGFLWAPLSVAFDTFGNVYVTEAFFGGDEKKGTAFFGRALAGIGVVVLVVPLFLYQHILKCTGFRVSMLLGGIIGALGWFGNGVAPNPTLFFVCCVVWAVGLNLLGPAVPTLITRQAPPSEFGRALGLLQSFSNVSRIVGPVLLSPLYKIDHSLVFDVATVSLLLVTAILLALSREGADSQPAAEAAENERTFDELLAGAGPGGIRAGQLVRQLSLVTPSSVRTYGGMPGMLSRARSLHMPSAPPLAPVNELNRSFTAPGEA